MQKTEEKITGQVQSHCRLERANSVYVCQSVCSPACAGCVSLRHSNIDCWRITNNKTTRSAIVHRRSSYRQLHKSKTTLRGTIETTRMACNQSRNKPALTDVRSSFFQVFILISVDFCDAVALVVGHRSFDAQVGGSTPGWAPPRMWPWASHLHLCACHQTV